MVLSQENTSYIYKADGQKVKKIFGTQTTDYLDGFQYENGLLQFFPTSEGFYNVERQEYVFNYTDHLGNVRLSYSAADGGGIALLEENNYYPFGLKHEGYNSGSMQLTSYTYGFQGQERQRETGWSSFKWRNAIPELGRFFNIDPLSEKYPYNSTYAFQENKLGMGVELEGLELLPHNKGYFAIHGNQMTVKQSPITQRDSFGRPGFTAGDIGLSTSGYNPNGARMSTGTTGLKLNSYRYSGATGSSEKMESIRGNDRPTNIWNKIYNTSVDKAGKISSGVKELVKNGAMALDIPKAIKSTEDYVQATNDINSVFDQAGVMGDAINYVDSSGIKMGLQLRNDVVNYVYDGKLPTGTDNQNGQVSQIGTSILNSNNLPIRPTSAQVKSMLEKKQKEIQNQINQIPH